MIPHHKAAKFNMLKLIAIPNKIFWVFIHHLYLFCLVQSGGPLVAQEEDVDETEVDPNSFLVGVVSFGPRHWFV